MWVIICIFESSNYASFKLLQTSLWAQLNACRRKRSKNEMGKCAFTQIQLASQAKCYVSPTNGLFKHGSTKTNIGESGISEFWSNMGCAPLTLSYQDCTGWEKAANLGPTANLGPIQICLGNTWKNCSLAWLFQTFPQNAISGLCLCITGFFYLHVFASASQNNQATMKPV